MLCQFKTGALFFPGTVLFALSGEFILIPVLPRNGLGLPFYFPGDDLFLLLFCLEIFFHKYGHHGKGVHACIIHQSGKS